MASSEILQAAKERLAQIQQYDAETLARVGDLGAKFNFSEIVPSAQTIIDLYKRLPLTILDDLTDAQLNQIIEYSTQDISTFHSIQTFDPQQANSNDVRVGLINIVKERKDKLFPHVWQFIAYGVARLTNTAELQAQAREMMEGIRRESEELTAHLTKNKEDADDVLKAIRQTAEEQGVSQQASYFQTEVTNQNKSADSWLKVTCGVALATGICAVLSLFIHKIEWLQPANRYEALQLVTSKFLIFAVLGYMLFLSAKNYLSHKHNSVVNQHRRNALVTYRALVEATGEKGTQDIILAHASACIFSPQESGFSQGKEGAPQGSKSILELMTRGGGGGGP